MPNLVWTDSVTVEWAPSDEPFDTTPTWTNITSLVTDITISRGRSGVFELFAAGTCSITLSNRLATIDPTVWYRWRQVRVTAAATGPVTNVLFRGFIEEVIHDQGGRAAFATATIQAVDLMGVAARYSFPAAEGSWAETRSGTRVDLMLAGIGIPSAWYSAADGNVDVAEIEPGVFNALQHLQDVVEAEAGSLYVTADGVLTFEDRYAQVFRITTPVTVFSDTYSGAEVPFLYGDVILTPPGRDYRNTVTFTGESDNPQTADNVPTGYPPDILSRTVPLVSDEQALANAELYLELYSQTGVVWPEHLTVSVFSQNILDEITALDLREYCQVEFTPAAKTQQTYKVFVDSIEHNMSGVTWTCRVGFSSADRWEDAWGVGTDYLILDDPTYGLLDQQRLGF